MLYFLAGGNQKSKQMRLISLCCPPVQSTSPCLHYFEQIHFNGGCFILAGWLLTSLISHSEMLNSTKLSLHFCVAHKRRLLSLFFLMSMCNAEVDFKRDWTGHCLQVTLSHLAVKTQASKFFTLVLMKCARKSRTAAKKRTLSSALESLFTPTAFSACSTSSLFSPHYQNPDCFGD